MNLSYAIDDDFTTALGKWAGVFMRHSMKDYVQFSKASGLSVTQMNTLFRLYHAGNCGISDIGDHLGVTNAAASQLVEQLVQLSLLQRVEDHSDRRVKRLSLTQTGRQLVEKSIDVRRRWMEQIAVLLTPSQQETISQALATLTEAALALEKIETVKE